MVAFGSGLVGPGEWIGVLGERVAAVLPPQSADLAARLWVSLDAGESFDDALDVVLRQGLSGVPSLVLVEAEGDGRVRLLVRGAPLVRVRTARSTVVGEAVAEIDSGTGTWHEQRFTDVLSVEVAVGGDAEATDEFTPGLRRLGVLHLGEPHGVSRPISQPLPKPVIQQVPTSEPVDQFADDAETGAIPVLSVVPVPESEPVAEAPLDEETAPLVAPWTPGPAAAPAPDPAPAAEAAAEPAGEPATEFDAADDVPTGATEVLSVAGASQATGAPGTVPVRAPGVPRLVFDHGDVLDLTGVVVLGRAPSAAASGSSDAVTFPVPSPLGEVSANHLEAFAGVGPDADRVVVVDLGSTNGTVVRREGHSARQLKPRIPVLLSDGDVVDLGDGVSFRVVSG